MNSLIAFLTPVEKPQQKEVIVSKRFVKRDAKGEPVVDDNGQYIPEPFIVRPISPNENNRLVQACTHPRKVDGKVVNMLDSVEYSRKMIVSATVYPDFRDTELCQAYGTLIPEEVPGLMLTIGEYQVLSDAIADVSGLSDEAAEADELALKN